MGVLADLANRRDRKRVLEALPKAFVELQTWCSNRIGSYERGQRMREELLTRRVEDLERQVRELNPGLAPVRRPVE